MPSVRKNIRDGWDVVIVTQQQCNDKRISHQDLIKYCKSLDNEWGSTLSYNQRGGFDSVFTFQNDADATLFRLRWQ